MSARLTRLQVAPHSVSSHGLEVRHGTSCLIAPRFLKESVRLCQASMAAKGDGDITVGRVDLTVSGSDKEARFFGLRQVDAARQKVGGRGVRVNQARSGGDGGLVYVKGGSGFGDVNQKSVEGLRRSLTLVLRFVGTDASYGLSNGYRARLNGSRYGLGNLSFTRSEDITRSAGSDGYNDKVTFGLKAGRGGDFWLKVVARGKRSRRRKEEGRKGIVKGFDDSLGYPGEGPRQPRNGKDIKLCFQNVTGPEKTVS